MAVRYSASFTACRGAGAPDTVLAVCVPASGPFFAREASNAVVESPAASDSPIAGIGGTPGCSTTLDGALAHGPNKSPDQYVSPTITALTISIAISATIGTSRFSLACIVSSLSWYRVGVIEWLLATVGPILPGSPARHHSSDGPSGIRTDWPDGLDEWPSRRAGAAGYTRGVQGSAP